MFTPDDRDAESGPAQIHGVIGLFSMLFDNTFKLILLILLTSRNIPVMSSTVLLHGYYFDIILNYA